MSRDDASALYPQHYDYEVIGCFLQSKIRPITANPKVRELKYSVAIKAVGDLRGAKSRLNLRDKGLSFEKWLQFNLYNFQEEWSQELATLFNPLSSEQQAKFQSLVKGFLGRTLDEAGFELVDAEFSC